MTDWVKIEKISNEILQEMGGDALEICTGDCPVFAKKMIDKLTDKGIEAVIVDNLSGEMKDELNGYKTINAEYENGVSHCYIKVDGWFFDAFDVDGCDNETEMKYHTECN